MCVVGGGGGVVLIERPNLSVFSARILDFVLTHFNFFNKNMYWHLLLPCLYIGFCFVLIWQDQFFLHYEDWIGLDWW